MNELILRTQLASAENAKEALKSRYQDERRKNKLLSMESRAIQKRLEDVLSLIHILTLPTNREV